MSKAFKTEKHGYRMADVDAFVAESNSAAAQSRERIAELKRELDEKEAELKSFKQKQDLIVKSIMGAVQKAEQIEQLIKQKYAGEMAHLTAFHQEWLEYYNKLIEKYPLSGELSPLKDFNRRLSAILSGNAQPEAKFAQANKQFEQERERLSGAKQKKYIGYIPVEDENAGCSGGDVDLGVGEGFDPEESIRQMLRRQAEEEQKRLSKQGAKNKQASGSISTGKAPQKNSPPLSPLSTKQLGEDNQGFSFEEALNPTQQLSDILKEIGLDFNND